ncbi:MAG: polysaccharide deacetylase family protein [Calditrichota bacterium]
MVIPDAERAQPRLLLFHKVSPTPEVGFTWLTPTKFARVVQNLTARGWISVGLDELRLRCSQTSRLTAGNASSNGTFDDTLISHGLGGRTFLSAPIGFVRPGGQECPLSKIVKSPLGIVFDDGYECIYHHALPVLADKGHTATVFIPTGYLGRANDWDYHLGGPRFRHLDSYQVKELAARGWTIGSHTVTHRGLTTLDPKAVKTELMDSKRCLEDITGKSVNWIAFPFGRYNLRILETAAEAGFTGAVVPVIIPLIELPSFPVYSADAIYWWDGVKRITRLVELNSTPRGGRLFRRAVNFCARGTIIWKRVLH